MQAGSSSPMIMLPTQHHSLFSRLKFISHYKLPVVLFSLFSRRYGMHFLDIFRFVAASLTDGKIKMNHQNKDEYPGDDIVPDARGVFVAEDSVVKPCHEAFREQ